MRFSSSQLKSWCRCAQEAKFKHLDRLPSLQHAKASFGTCIHEALEMYNNGVDIEECVERFKLTWEHPELLDAMPDIWPDRGKGFAALRKQGIEMLRTYHKINAFEDREVLGTEIAFEVPFGDHTLRGYVDLLEIKRSAKGKPVLRIVDYKTNARQPTKVELALDLQFCADEETEILTRNGWKRYSELNQGEDVMTIDSDWNGEWQPALSVNVFDAADQDLLSMEGKAHSSLTTLNHRWPVKHVVSSGNGWRIEDRIVLSENLTGSDRIACAANVINLPTEPVIDDALVEVIAWFWTEGFVMEGGSLSFSQSQSVNPDKVSLIETALRSRWGMELERLNRTEHPCWRKSSDSDVNRYYLNRAASKELSPYFFDLKNKVLSYGFINSLTESQLRLFLDLSMAADGHGYEITQSMKERLDPLQMACSLLGIRTSLREKKIGGKGKYAGRIYWSLSLKKDESNFVPKKDVRNVVKYTGKVWCPTTDNQTWLARRNGHVYYTGNTAYLYASFQPEFWEFKPELYEELLDYPRRAIWYHMEKVKEIDAGPRDEGDFNRMYTVAEMAAKAVEAGIYMPDVSGANCHWCSFTEECTSVSIVSRKVKPDYEFEDDEEGF